MRVCDFVVLATSTCASEQGLLDSVRIKEEAITGTQAGDATGLGFATEPLTGHSNESGRVIQILDFSSLEHACVR